ncbi:MAG: hypothetical protein IPM16_17245 [Chloroflexi bacterium]|nr:hypothetical protein [Chloroflexota bacterium]
MIRRLSLSLLLIAFVVVPAAAQQTPSAPTTGALVVWISEGIAPDTRPAGFPSEVAAVLPNGTVSTLLEFDTATIGVQRCSSRPTSTDGRRFAFFASQPSAGIDRGTLYQMTDLGAPQVVAVTHKLTCALENFAYSPNGAQMAYIDFANYDENLENITGTLRVIDTDSLQPQAEFERVAAFTLENDELLYLQFFPNASDQVTEVAVSSWDGGTGREVSSITAVAGCRFTGGAITAVGEDAIAVVMGERCRARTGQVRWQVYLVDRASRSSTLLASGAQAGGYFPATQTYMIAATRDGSAIVFSASDGLARDSASVYTIDLLAADPSAEPIINRAATVRRYVPLRYALGDIATALRSPNGRYWALGVNAPEGAELAVLDVSAAGPPIRIPINRAGDAVRAMGFTLDSTALLYTTGGAAGRDTSLYRLDLQSGVETLVARGQYAATMAVRADGAVALIQYKQTTETSPRPYVDVVVVDPDGTQRDRLGGVVLDAQGFLEGFRVAVPLAWR